MDFIKENWELIKETLKKEYSITEISYTTWVSPLQCYEVKDDEVVILIPSDQAHALNYINNTETIILDPPRAGIDRKLAERLLEVAPPKIAYLSCNPATQARDIKILLEKYHIDKVKTFNFFPHTPHIENLVVLSL